ncbi:hypothetical protein KZX37_07045 [Microbacterium sp. EYE_5]|uniref:hypothetical protein n=1 Tax=unclassified Microbacterium TaxID=2609290 RepID=UPI0020059878|nr:MULTISPECIES: hypothetical protein [unclassified Microbacterium]MCK6080373.1 hypothetical protein [Microbacterium sp. EYE_382]MCK6085644.1 hypothetical protein [Microbacterium sp. EYE_384]MCK6122131.1 hypothetical protein [Microbacterium sp. EYE_80]MCK6126407.1 hypothetical protein [Microbacterium sp. EYE_79]MCK6141328.1 hypothetical protein [Microbacterium sp. EYE_39]
MTRSRIVRSIARVFDRLLGPASSTRRDDTKRAGGPISTDPRQASRRAEGSTAWTRIGGGGAV